MTKRPSAAALKLLGALTITSLANVGGLLGWWFAAVQRSAPGHTFALAVPHVAAFALVAIGAIRERDRKLGTRDALRFWTLGAFSWLSNTLVLAHAYNWPWHRALACLALALAHLTTVSTLFMQLAPNSRDASGYRGQLFAVAAATAITPLCAVGLAEPSSFGLLGAAACCAALLGAVGAAAWSRTLATLRSDIAIVTTRVESAVAGSASPLSSRVRPSREQPKSEPVQTSEARELSTTVDLMVSRIIDSHVAHYLAIEKAKEAERLKSQFLANMSHDLRSPLNAILGFSELLLHGIDGELNLAQREMVEQIFTSGRGLLREIDDVLHAAKLDSGTVGLEIRPTPIAPMVTQACKWVRTQLGDVPTIDIQLDAGLPTAVCDTDHTLTALKKVLLFACQGDERPNVTVSVRHSGTPLEPKLWVRVHTQHCPTDAATLARARVGFARIPGHRGLGLGLTLAHALLKLQHSELEIDPYCSGLSISFELQSIKRVRRVKTQPDFDLTPPSSSDPPPVSSPDGHV